LRLGLLLVAGGWENGVIAFFSTGKKEGKENSAAPLRGLSPRVSRGLAKATRSTYAQHPWQAPNEQ
jgi:hypothetical protein